MWVLAWYLPLMIGHMVSCDDSNWLNFLLLLEISRDLFAPRIDDDDIAEDLTFGKIHDIILKDSSVCFFPTSI